MQFEELKMWQDSQDIYSTLAQIFNKEIFKDYFFRDQILRTTLSISNNIAEWFERETNNELRRFLYIAKWSCWEVRSMLHLAYKNDYIDQLLFEQLADKAKHISIMVYKYIQKLQ